MASKKGFGRKPQKNKLIINGPGPAPFPAGAAGPMPLPGGTAPMGPVDPDAQGGPPQTFRRGGRAKKKK